MSDVGGRYVLTLSCPDVTSATRARQGAMLLRLVDDERIDLVGCDRESVALARAVKYHIERRVLLNGNRTAVFH